MSEFNKIFTTSPVNISYRPLMTLCFNNGKVLSKSKYALENDTLTLYEDTCDTLSLFYSNGIADIYEFNTMFTSINGIQLPTVDKNQQTVKTLNKNRLLIFIDGVLELSNNYDVIENNVIILNNQHVTDRVHDIVVFASDLDFVHTIYTPTETQTLADQINLNAIKVKYNVNRTLLFIDGIKVDFNRIEIIDKNTIKLNIPQTINEITTFEIVNLVDEYDDTISLNFNTDQGYLTYGPEDDFGKKIPTMYNMLLTFSTQTKILVDNLRPGFIFKAADGYGEALVVDNNFETKELKCIQLSLFRYKSYTANDYYFEVPESKSIVNYLSEYDRKYTFLPEILTVFQRLILDELQDSIQRLRDSRSIQKVDSVNINKLLYLLGFNVNIKSLNKKQRRELIEELNEFYRVVGTRNSYNLLNILQNDLKLINIEQLFTPYGSLEGSGNKEIIYEYNCVVDREGDGYELLDHLYTLEDPSISGTVTEIEETDPQKHTGKIKSFQLTTTEGANDLNRVYHLTQDVANAQFTITSTADRFDYSSSVTSTTGFEVGQTLETEDKKFKINVTSINPDTSIKTWNLIPSSGTSSISLNAVNLAIPGTYLDITSTRNNDTISFENYTPVGGTPVVGGVLDPGIYTIEIGGAGGGGSAGTRTEAHTCSATVHNGKAGEKITKTIILTKRCKIRYCIGEGGIGGKVIITTGRTNKITNGTGGIGYQQGQSGQGGGGTWHNEVRGAAVAPGGGGGSSFIQIEDNVTGGMIQTITARGGAGANAEATRYKSNNINAIGGLGGGSNSYNDNFNGPAGGNGTYLRYENNNGVTVQGNKGTNGYIKIYAHHYSYSGKFRGNLAQVIDGDEQIVRGTYTPFIVKAIVEDGKKIAQVTPIAGTFDESITVTWSPDLSAELTVSSTPVHYQYNLSTNGLSGKYLKVGSTLKTDTNPTFTYEILGKDANDNITSFRYSPTQGDTYYNFVKVDAYQQTGTGAQIAIRSSRKDMSNVDRCYIDFYKKEELGAELKEEYRIDKIDYLTITEGTPHSPIWWIPGKPDLDYGYITDETSVIPENYGLITTKVKGEWVQWWEWDRKSIWYPTNHVDVELKLPTDVNFKEYIETFVEQFYSLASTVVFIHQITESFIFGNESDTNSKSKEKEVSSFGIAVGAPYVDYEFTLTSNPHVQYHETKPTTCTLAIVPTPADAVVTMNGQVTNSLEVNYGDTIEWTVEKTGYKSRDVIREMFKDATKYVILKPEYTGTTLHFPLTA